MNPIFGLYIYIYIYWFIDVLVCGRFGLATFCVSTFWSYGQCQVCRFVVTTGVRGCRYDKRRSPHTKYEQPGAPGLNVTIDLVLTSPCRSGGNHRIDIYHVDYNTSIGILLCLVPKGHHTVATTNGSVNKQIVVKCQTYTKCEGLIIKNGLIFHPGNSKWL